MESRIGNDTIKSSLKFTDTTAWRACNIFDNPGRNSETERIGFRAEDSKAMLIFWCLNVDQQAPLKARTQAILQAIYRLGWSIAGDYNLLASIMQTVERMKKLLFS